MSGASDNIKNQLVRLEVETFEHLFKDPEINRLHTANMLGELNEVVSPYKFALLRLLTRTVVEKREQLEDHIRQVIENNKEDIDFLPLRNYITLVEKNRVFLGNEINENTTDVALIDLLESSFGKDISLIQNVPSIEALYATVKREAIPLSANEILANDIHHHLTSKSSSDSLDYYIDNHSDKDLVNATEAVRSELNDLFHESIFGSETSPKTKPSIMKEMENKKQKKLEQFDVEKFLADLKAEKEKQGVVDTLNNATKSVNEFLEEATQTTGTFIKENGKAIGGAGTIATTSITGLAVAGPVGLAIGAGIGLVAAAFGAGISSVVDSSNKEKQKKAEQEASRPVENAIIETPELSLHILTKFFNETLANRLPNSRDFELLNQVKSEHQKLSKKLAEVKTSIERKKQAQLSIEAARKYIEEEQVLFIQTFGLNDEMLSNNLSSLTALDKEACDINRKISNASREFDPAQYEFTSYKRLADNANYKQLKKELRQLLNQTSLLRGKLVKLKSLMDQLPTSEVVDNIQNSTVELSKKNHDQLIQLLKLHTFSKEQAQLNEIAEDIHNLPHNPITKINTAELSNIKVLCDNAFAGKSEQVLTKHLNNYQRVVGNLNALSKRLQQVSADLEKQPLVNTIESLLADTAQFQHKPHDGLTLIADDLLENTAYAATHVTEIKVKEANTLRTTISALQKSLEDEIAKRDADYKAYEKKMKNAEEIYEAIINSVRFRKIVKQDEFQYVEEKFKLRFQKEMLDEIISEEFELNNDDHLNDATTKAINAFIGYFSLAVVLDECDIYQMHLSEESKKSNESVNPKAINIDEFSKSLVMEGKNKTRIDISHKMAYNNKMRKMILGEATESHKSADILKNVSSFAQQADVSYVYNANRKEGCYRILRFLGRFFSFGLYKGEAMGSGVKRNIADVSLAAYELHARKRFKSSLFSSIPKSQSSIPVEATSGNSNCVPVVGEKRKRQAP